MEFPIDIKDMSPQKKLNLCEEIIDEYSKIQKIGDHSFVILPAFKLNGNFKLKMDIYPGRDILVDLEIYEKYDLGVYPVYIAEDSADKRPALLMPQNNLFVDRTSKTFLVDLIVGSVQDPSIELYYKDGDMCNLKTNNLDFRNKESSPGLTTPDSVPPFAGKIKEPLVTQEEINAFKEVGILSSDNSKSEDQNINSKVLKIMENIDNSRGLSPLENQYLTNGKIDSNDASKLRHPWLGVTKYGTKHGPRYSANIKGVVIESGFAHALDAARKYNEFVLEHGLPYPVNNIPGFLPLEINRQGGRHTLGDYETWALAEELNRRLRPEDMKF